MAIINSSVIEQFEKLTRFSLSSLLIDFSEFMSYGRSQILDYYSGLTRDVDRDSFSELNRLSGEFELLNNVIENNRTRFKSTLFWELLESLSDMRQSLLTIENSSKWERSAISKNDFTPGIEVNHTLNMLETLERVSRVISGSSDPQNEWITIALRNDLIEEGYTSRGGNNLSIGFKNRATIQIRSVIDTINQDTIYGKDFDKKLQIDPVSEDIVVLSPQQTLIQSIEILGTLKQGDTPEYRGEGISSGLVVGGNRNSISYPILTRQIFNTFQKDDTLKSMRIVDIDLKDDALSIEIEVETRLGEFLSIQI